MIVCFRMNGFDELLVSYVRQEIENILKLIHNSVIDREFSLDHLQNNDRILVKILKKNNELTQITDLIQVLVYMPNLF